MRLETVDEILKQDCFCHNISDVRYIIETMPKTIVSNVNLDAHCSHHQHDAIKEVLVQVQSFFKTSQFKVGARIQLAKTPNVNVKDAPGWMSYRHLLVEGANGTVAEVSYYKDRFSYGIIFDNDTTWIDSKDVIRTRSNTTDKSMFHFKESELRSDGSQTMCEFLRGLWHDFYAKRGD